MRKIKPKANKRTINKTFLLIGLVILLALVGIFIKKMLVSPQVALIAEPISATCTTNINSISFHDECAVSGTFRRAVYTCSNGATAEKLAGGTNCILYNDVIKEAQNNCGQTCTGPSPIPTCVPNPCPGDGRTCKLAALPAGQSYCPIATPVPSPSPTSTPYPSPTPKPSVVPTPTPTPTPIPTPKPSTSMIPSAPPACKAQELTHYAFREICPVPAGATEQYRFIDYTCGDETVPRTMGSSDTCQFYTSLKSGAEFYCRKNSCVTPTTTPVATLAPRSVTKQTFRQCFNTCRANKRGAVSCARYCLR